MRMNTIIGWDHEKIVRVAVLFALRQRVCDLVGDDVQRTYSRTCVYIAIDARQIVSCIIF